jgi:hypothetical protein
LKTGKPISENRNRANHLLDGKKNGNKKRNANRSQANQQAEQKGNKETEMEKIECLADLLLEVDVLVPLPWT